MKKILSLMLITVSLLISTNVRAAVLTVGTSGADYVNFDEARNAASAGDEIKFVTDQTWSGATEGTHKGYLSKNLTINFNGKTITRTGGSNIFSTNGVQNIIFTGTEGSRVVYSSSVYALRFYNGQGGTFTFQGNIRIDAPMPFGSLSNSCTNTVTIAEGATLTITGDIVDPKTTFINNGTLIIDGGTFEGTNGNKAFTGNYEVKSGLFKQSVYDTYVAGHMPKGTLTGVEGDYTRVAQPIANPVAQIGVAQYATLTAAVAAASDGNEIDLVKDITETIDSNPLTKKRLVIDFNGHTWTNSGHLRTGATELTLKSSTGVGKYVGNHTSTIYLQTANCVLTIDNVQVSGGASNDIGISQAGTSVVVKNGTTFAKSIANSTNAFTLKFDNVPYSKLWNGTGDVSVVNLGDMTLTKNPSEASSFTNSGTLIIDGGTYTTNNVFNGTYTIKSGLFLKSMYDNGGLGSHVLSGSLTQEMSISEIAYVQVAQPVPGAVAKIGAQGYTSLDAAISAAISGQTITLLADINYYNKQFSLPNGVSLNRDGHKLYVNSGRYGATIKAILDIPSGYKWVDTPVLGSMGYRVVDNDATVVAIVDEYEYYMLSEALLQSSLEHPAVLQADNYISNESNGLQIRNGKHCLDLNGNTLYINDGFTFFGWYQNKEAGLTIQNGKMIFKQSCKRYPLSFSAEYVNTDPQNAITASLDIKSNVEIVDEYKKYFILIYRKGSAAQGTAYHVDINIDAKLDVGAVFYVHGNAQNKEQYPVFNIGKNADIKCDIIGYAAGFAEWNISGKAVCNTMGIYAKAGHFNFENASITANGEYNDPVPDGSGAEMTGDVITFDSKNGYAGDMQLSISGTTYLYSKNAYAIREAWTDATVSATQSMHISGGTFEGNKGGLFTSDAFRTNVLAANAEITGGIYSNDVSGLQDKDGKNYLHPDYTTSTIQHMGQTMYVVHKKFVPGSNINDNAGQNPLNAYQITGTQLLNQDETNAYYVEVVGTDDAHKASLIIKEGQTLNIGNGGLVVGDYANVIVEPDGVFTVGQAGVTSASSQSVVIQSSESKFGSFLINPDVFFNNQPYASVDLITNVGKQDEEYYWHRFAMPITSANSWTKNPSVGTFLYGWNYDTNDWYKLPNGVKDMVPLKGYTLTHDQSYPTQVTYTFTGNILGNVESLLDFRHFGFNYFGNSYTGYIDAKTMLNEVMNDDNVGGSIWLWDVDNQQFIGVSRRDLNKGRAKMKEIAPMHTFILQLLSDKVSNVSIDYESAIWGNPRYNLVQVQPNNISNWRDNSEESYATIIFKAANGQTDEINICQDKEFSDAYENGADVTKFMNIKHLNTYAVVNGDELSTVVTDNLIGTEISLQTTNDVQYTISFANIEGQTYILKDNQTENLITMEEGYEYHFTAAPNSLINKRFQIVSSRGITTDIENKDAFYQNIGIYTIMGQYIGCDWKNLPQGVYIINGEKVVK